MQIAQVGFEGAGPEAEHVFVDDDRRPELAHDRDPNEIKFHMFPFVPTELAKQRVVGACRAGDVHVCPSKHVLGVIMRVTTTSRVHIQAMQAMLVQYGRCLLRHALHAAKSMAPIIVDNDIQDITENAWATSMYPPAQID